MKNDKAVCTASPNDEPCLDIEVMLRAITDGDPRLADPHPGVLSLQRETPVTIEEPPVTARDQQLFDRAGMPEIARLENERLRVIASRACANCVGHCCLAFDIGRTMDEVQKQLDKVCEEAYALLHHEEVMSFHWKGRPVPDMALRAAVMLRQIEEWEFYLANLSPVVTSDKHTTVFSCDRFDRKTHRCTVYETRPQMCRSYICGAAAQGRPARMSDGMMTKVVPTLQAYLKRHEAKMEDQSKLEA